MDIRFWLYGDNMTKFIPFKYPSLNRVKGGMTELKITKPLAFHFIAQATLELCTKLCLVITKGGTAPLT